MIDPVTGCFEIMEYDYKQAITIKNLVETTWLNEILEIIHSALGNLVRTYTIKDAYIDEDDPCLGIFSFVEFAIHYNANNLKGYTLVQLIVGRDIILQVKHNTDW